MPEFGTKLESNAVGTYTWNFNTTNVRTAEARVSNDGGGVTGLVTFLETTEEITVDNIYIHGQLNAGTTGSIDVWVVEANDTDTVGTWTPDSDATAAALTTPQTITFTSGDGETTKSVAVNQTIPAGKKLKLVGKPTTAQASTSLNIANLDSELGGTGQSLSASDDVTDTWLTGNRSLAIWADYEPVTTAPTLTTSYAKQSVVETDIVNIPSQFTGAASYELIGAPATLTINSSTGLISGTVTETESFVAYATVAATNSFGTTYAPIVFAVGANAGKSVNSINYDLWATDTSQVGAGKAYNDLLEDYNELP
jgi:hypothetical protein